MIDLSEQLIKLKGKVLFFSALALFVSLTKKFPDKIAIVGLDLSSEKSIIGWFLFYLLVYLMFSFLVKGIFEIVGFNLENIIHILTRNNTGEYLGFSKDDITNREILDIDPHEHIPSFGTIKGEKESLNYQLKQTENIVHRWYKKSYVAWVFLIDFLLPFCFSIYCSYMLYSFLRALN